MIAKGAFLRNIHTSGGLFTENILLRLRDNPTQLKIGKIETFKVASKKELDTKQSEIFEWCKQKWDEISPNLDSWKLEESIEKWLIPFFEQFDHELELFEINENNVDKDSPIKDFQISHQSKDHKNPSFHFVDINEEFDSKISSNPQGKSHHTVCQQFINLNPEIEWLIISNGRILRLLTKYYHTYSKGFLEFNVENILANRDLIEFNTLYSTLHSSRFIAEAEDQVFLINQFQKESVSEGVKIGDSLRDKVHNAIELLGDELIQQNPTFLDKIIAKEIDPQEYYAELLRIIYRIIFILYAEQREMLPGAGSIYFEQFSLSSLRFQAEKPIKAEKNTDLWNKLFLTFKLINEGNDFLGVNAYNGSLFKNKSENRNEGLPIILKNNLRIINEDVLKVIRLLTTSKVNNVLQRINFLEISEIEIGGVYESLLDYKPIFDTNNHFQLIEGTERKSTGSYYTPSSLIDILIRTTLQPLVEDRLYQAGDDKKNREKAILDLKVCDPACGGGTFLLSALDFLGKKLAEVRIDSPLENDLREARRVVLQHCIYGVDMNPLAVELAKISLWLRACVKDRPLSFLDNHIKCGNSLIGLGKKTEIGGIETNAFKAISGNKSTGILNENAKLQNMARKIINDEIKEQKKSKKKVTTITAFMTDKRTADICSIEFQKIIDMSESGPDEIRQKEKMYNDLRKNESYQQALDEANIWTSTFFWSFEGTALGEIPRYTTIQQLREKTADPELLNLMEKINKIAKDNQFFHWYIEFPEVFSSERGGFDSILTNPPWENVQLREMEFFTGLNSDIVNARNQAKRREIIKKLKNNEPILFNRYQFEWRKIKKWSHFLNTSGIFNLTAKGTLNTYSLFTERCWYLISKNGVLGIIVPTGIIVNYFMQDFFKQLIQENSINCIFDFVNRKAIFKIHRDYKFCLLSIGFKNSLKDFIPMTFYTKDPQEIQSLISPLINEKTLLKENKSDILIPFRKTDFELFNPNTFTCPSFKNRRDYDLLKKIYTHSSILIKRDKDSEEIISNPWDIQFLRMFDMSNDSNIFFTFEKLSEMKALPIHNNSKGGIWVNKENRKFYPLYEGKMIWIYNHRFNSSDFAEDGKKRKAVSIETQLDDYKNPNFCIKTLYWISKSEFENKISENNYDKNWYIVFRAVTGSSNLRTFVSSIVPKTPIGNTLITVLSKLPPEKLCCLIANFNSIIFDYAVRQKITTTYLNYFLVEQFPVFPPEFYSKELIDLIVSKVIKLIYNSVDLNEFAKDLGYSGPPYGWNLQERAKLQAELDAIYFYLYKINRDELEYIIDSFNVLKSRELSDYKEFRSRKLILEAFDELKSNKYFFKY